MNNINNHQKGKKAAITNVEKIMHSYRQACALFPVSPGELLEHGPFSECWQYVQLIICIVLAATAEAVSAMDAAQPVSAKRFKSRGLRLFQRPHAR